MNIVIPSCVRTEFRYGDRHAPRLSSRDKTETLIWIEYRCDLINGSAYSPVILSIGTLVLTGPLELACQEVSQAQVDRRS
jgi:hypothetical protein